MTEQKLNFQRIGIGGNGPTCGKNATANIITELWGYRQVSFAEALRKEVAEVTLHSGDIPFWEVFFSAIEGSEPMLQLDTLLRQARKRHLNPWAKPTDPLMRRILQLWGTDFRRAQDEDYWVKQIDLEGKVVGTDIRFQNERKCFEETLYVFRPGLPEPTHASEQQLRPEDCHWVIVNDGGLDELRASVMAWANARLISAC